MSIDLTKLTPAPWTVEPSCAGKGWGFDVPELPEADYRDSRFGNQDDADFIALARNAFDVMMRRGWSVERGWSEGLGWGSWFCPVMRCSVVETDSGNKVYHPDPFTALLATEAWYVANVEGKQP